MSKALFKVKETALFLSFSIEPFHSRSYQAGQPWNSLFRSRVTTHSHHFLLPAFGNGFLESILPVDQTRADGSVVPRIFLLPHLDKGVTSLFCSSWGASSHHHNLWESIKRGSAMTPDHLLSSYRCIPSGFFFFCSSCSLNFTFWKYK